MAPTHDTFFALLPVRYLVVMFAQSYHKNTKFWDAKKIAVIILKFVILR